MPESFTSPEPHVRLGAVGARVHHDDTRLHALGELQRAMDAGRVDRRGEAVGRVVDDPERLVETRGSVEHGDGAEELGARDLRRGAGALDHGRLDVPARPLEAPPAGEHCRSVRVRLLDGMEDPHHRLPADDRLRVERPRGLEQALAEGVVDRVEDDDPTGRGAALARVREGGGDRPGHGVAEVRVVADDERVLATELEARLRQPTCRRLVDRAPGRGRAREAHEVDVGMLDERSARFGLRGRGRR